MSQTQSQDTSTQPAAPQSDAEGAMARLRRTVNEASESAKSYLGQLGSSSSTSQPTTPKPDENHKTTDSKSGIPQPGDGFRKPTAFERFMSLGKARKDWEVEWPPSHWADSSGVYSPS